MENESYLILKFLIFEKQQLVFKLELTTIKMLIIRFLKKLQLNFKNPINSRERVSIL